MLKTNSGGFGALTAVKRETKILPFSTFSVPSTPITWIEDNFFCPNTPFGSHLPEKWL